MEFGLLEDGKEEKEEGEDGDVEDEEEYRFKGKSYAKGKEAFKKQISADQKLIDSLMKPVSFFEKKVKIRKTNKQEEDEDESENSGEREEGEEDDDDLDDIDAVHKKYLSK
jgi:hypothetical protein